ncbi:3',5'-cyclic-nucleotide phosphodiesterase [Marinobacterium litorale]|uniref:3',5'-cyclic-nucleotide phosphodiesterase n=1 Tax=Marinobacterium litorale TaxID=404770 RepID=UPI0003F70EA9|nr:3',5'-cyclic-nucleotide phosphodiesterase [Marinobacterium litorale]
MKIEILGCSGGIGPGLKTTCFRIDEAVLLDAGSGIEHLPIDDLLEIRHVLITHAHLDHILGLPLMLATIYDKHKEPVTVHALPDVIEALKRHIFNWVVWPDFSALPDTRPILNYHPIDTGTTCSIGPYTVTSLPAEHPSPTSGFFISKGGNSFAFTGDSSFHRPFWEAINRLQPQLVIADISFSDEAHSIAEDSGHMTASQLSWVENVLTYKPDLRATHLKVGFEEEIAASVLNSTRLNVKPLIHGETIRL